MAIFDAPLKCAAAVASLCRTSTVIQFSVGIRHTEVVLKTLGVGGDSFAS